jgi:hypothetical protein
MSGRPIRRGLAALVAASVASVALALPAGAKDDVDRRIRRSVEATQREETARITFRLGIVSERAEGEITGDGAFSLTDLRGQVVLDISDLVSSPATLEERVVDGVIYIDFGPLLGAAGETVPDALGGRRWVRIDVSALTGLDAEQLQSLDPSGGATPSSQLDSLRGIDDAVRIGTEEIAGIRTTRFRGTIRLALARTALEALPDEIRAEAEAALEQLFRGDRTLPVDLWLDDQNRMRQMRTRIEIEDPERVLLTMTMTIPEFDVPLDVVAPPAEETIDFGEFLDLGGS